MAEFPNRYNRVEKHMYYLAHHSFLARCRSNNVYHFTSFIGIVATTDWTDIPHLYRGHVAS
jgi:hypothetical protein